MRAVFGNSYNAKKEEAIAKLPDPDNSTQLSPYVVTAWHHTTLPTGETLLLTNALELDNNDSAIQYHPTSGLLSLYVLRKKDDKWQVIKRNENFDALGSFGNPGKAHWVQLGNGKPGLAMEHGGTWQGFTIEMLALYDVSHGSVRMLTEDPINVHSDSNGGCSPTGPCWDVSGKWRLASAPSGTDYDDLLIDFTGEEMDPVEGATENTELDVKRTTKPVKAQARYRFDGVAYRLVSGNNPARSF